MKTTLAAAVLAATLGATYAGAADRSMKKAEDSQIKGAAVAVEHAETVATVEKVDRKGRKVTIADESGEKVVINVPKEVKNLKEVEPGSTFKIHYLQSAAVALTKPGEEPAMEEDHVTLMPKDGSGKAAVVETKEVSGMILDIDRSDRTLTVQGPDKKAREVTVAENVSGFDDAKVGDNIVLRYTEAVALEAVKQPKGKS